MNSKQTEGNTVRDFLKEYYEWDENEHEPQQPFIHSSISDLEQLITDYFASLPSKPVGDVEDELKKWVDVVGIVQRDHGEVAFMETAKELLNTYGPIKSGYAAAPQKGMGADDWGNGWDSAITLANNLCMQVSDEYNNDDEIEQATAANSCALRVRKYLGDRSYKPESFPPDESPSPSEAGDGWVSVEDGLPEKTHKSEYLVFHNPRYDGDDEVTQCGFHSIDAGIWPYATHWRKRPTPPIQKAVK